MIQSPVTPSAAASNQPSPLRVDEIARRGDAVAVARDRGRAAVLELDAHAERAAHLQVRGREVDLLHRGIGTRQLEVAAVELGAGRGGAGAVVPDAERHDAGRGRAPEQELHAGDGHREGSGRRQAHGRGFAGHEATLEGGRLAVDESVVLQEGLLPLGRYGGQQQANGRQKYPVRAAQPKHGDTSGRGTAFPRHRKGIRDPPDAIEEAVHALDALRAPRLGRFERAHEHLVEAHRVGAVLAMTSSGLTTLPRDFDIFWPSSPRIMPWLTSLLERLGRGDVAEVVEDLVPEARVEQVQHRVLGAADVEVDAASSSALLLRPGRLGRCGVDVAQVVPARAGPLRHRVGLARARLPVGGRRFTQSVMSRAGGLAGAGGLVVSTSGSRAAARTRGCGGRPVGGDDRSGKGSPQ
jgi:hypothetical protein